MLSGGTGLASGNGLGGLCHKLAYACSHIARLLQRGVNPFSRSPTRTSTLRSQGYSGVAGIAWIQQADTASHPQARPALPLLLEASFG